MRLNVDHSTHYTYAQQVQHSTQYLRLTPQDSAHQRILSWQLTLPEDAICTTDAFGNVLHVLTLDKPHQAITIQAQGVVEIEDNMEDDSGDHLSPLVFLRHSPLTQPDFAIRQFASGYCQGVTHADAQLDCLTLMMGELLAKMPYSPGTTTVQDSAAQAFAAGQGVCQDHTHVFLACCRSLNIPARYVSGYLYTESSSHVATHAWAEVWLDGHWQSFDVTNNTCKPNQHLKLAVGIDYLDACPVRGIRRGGGYEDMQTIAAVHMLSTPRRDMSQ
ncbi:MULTISPECIES: transglutaminase family protein [Yersinia]|uniref:Transglutaminase family protein n=1 Tax=Yersinia bercovieri TaxID=634 RepID=A0A2G4U8K4_YERBE|nr:MULTISPECIES: transglutaminase family protein [Yersinia]MCB5302272.1 transglutaminase family protein [Yersinia bercovieri]PHZ29046.1 transglutaminase family protein [Yersinia bercovieri]QDW32002.1 transglutaminase family protein [Yersinia sp. KBS0713]QKJ06159.1 transglutaminase family protein [Yersinia bercovieri ATCC 43970]CFQ43753.1 protein containing transglutaminase-like domain%2Cputative cysteine protease [Yersinia bercovieri]